MRLNWFLPLRQPVKKENTGSAEAIRRVLEKIGPTWGCSPVRRVIQAGCFVAWALLFFYVCWPYTARPARAWHNWLPVKVDAATGKAVVVTERPGTDPILPNMVLYAVDGSHPEGQDGIPFRVARVGDQQLVLQPVAPLGPQQLDKLSAGFGPWSLHEAPPGSWPSHYADGLQAREKVAAEAFLAVDPLVSISTGLAARTWVWSLAWAGIILLVCVVVPRGFCGYLCPLGTLIDLFDWIVGRRVARLGAARGGWWVHIKYYLLLAVLTAAVFGVLISGFVAAIPMVTRGMAFLLTPLQTAAERGWHQVPPLGAGHFVSIGLFFAVLGLGLLRPRFWCKYVCPSGAVFSVGNVFRLSQRQVQSSCIRCGRCLEICPFDAIQPDFTTRITDCTFCQTCGGVCPTRAIRFVPRWNKAGLKAANDPPTGETAIGRRGFLAAAVGGLTGCLGGVGAAAVTRAGGAGLDDPTGARPVRPPGSVPEKEFLRLCIRCGECFQACPNDVLQPLGWQQGPEGLWTPQVVANWSGCEPSCNNCGQVCPTGAIRALPLDEKRAARMGRAVVNQRTCLPYARREECQLCVDECVTAGYEAIEFVRVGTEVDDSGHPIEGTGFLAPVVLPEKCVGCGLCQTRCSAINAVEKGLLHQTAIRVEAGEGKEDRLIRGSYTRLREQERARREGQQERLRPDGAADSYLPDFLD